MEFGAHMKGLAGFMGLSWWNLLAYLRQKRQPDGSAFEGSADIASPSTAFSSPGADTTRRATCLDQFLSFPIMEAIGLWLGPTHHDSCSMPALSLPWRQHCLAVKLLSCKDLKPVQKLNTPGIEHNGFSEHWSKRMQMYWKHVFLQVLHNYHLCLQELFPSAQFRAKTF